MARMTAAQAAVEILKAEGVTNVFGLPGAAINPFYNAMRLNGGLHHKDMGIVTSAAREAGVILPLGAIAAQLMASARACGDGGLDHSALLRGVERLAGSMTYSTETER